MKVVHNMKSLPKKKFLVSIVIPIGLVACIFAMLVLIANMYLNKIQYESADPNSQVNEPGEQGDEPADPPADSQGKLFENDVMNILFIGTDVRSQTEGPGRTDSMILISVNKETKKIIATSFLRDIYVKIPGKSQGDKLNAAYPFGGISKLFETLEENFEIKVDKFVSVDFFSFIKVIDIMGGVEIDLSSAEVRVANDYIRELNGLLGKPKDDGVLTNAGVQTLDGKQALGFARNRYTGTDFNRTDRQRLVLEKIFEKAKTLNIIQMKKVLDGVLGEVKTNLSKTDLLSIIMSATTYLKYSIESWHIPIDGAFEYDTIRTQSVIVVDFKKNIEALQAKIYGDDS